MSYSLLRPPVCSACARQLQGVRAAPHPSPRAVCPAHRCQLRVLCAASGDGPDGPSAVPEKFVNIRDILDDVGGTDFVFEDKEEGDVWAHEGRLAASPPAPEELEAKPEVKGALSPEAADILTAYSSEQGFREVGVDELYAQLHSPADAGATERAAGAGAEDAPAVLDVRTRGEFAGGRVPGAVNVPLDELSDAVRSGRLDDMRGRPVAVVCAIGKRSAQATVRLTRVFAFEDAYNIAGGTYAWQAAGYPLEYDR